MAERAGGEAEERTAEPQPGGRDSGIAEASESVGDALAAPRKEEAATSAAKQQQYDADAAAYG